jgi:putative effector of murein hydrolase
MAAVGIMFFLLAAYHIYEDFLGAGAPIEVHLVPIIVLIYALYEYRRLIREAASASLD